MQRKCPRHSTYYLLDDRCNDTVEGPLNQTDSMDTAASSCSRVHEAYKISAKEFGCFGCKNTYTKMSSAKTHADAENGIKSFSCKVCARGFTRKADMGRHVRDQHTRVSPFLCPQCQAPFARKAHKVEGIQRLQRLHIIFHPMLKPETSTTHRPYILAEKIPLSPTRH